MDEESNVFEPEPKQEPYYVCDCLLDDASSEEVFISFRKQQILTTVARTEAYLKERRIPELIRFLMTKLIAEAPSQPSVYLEKLLDDCMLFRAGHALPPVLYQDRHLKEVVKSFDPGQRGWLSIGQINRLYATLGLTLEEIPEDNVPTDVVLENLIRDQEHELFALISAGMNIEGPDDSLNSSSNKQF